MSCIKKQIVSELHKPARKNFRRRRMNIKGFDETHQADLADMSIYAQDNNGYKFIFVLIDCFSKYLWTHPLKDKSGITCAAAIENIFNTSRRVPKNLHTDLGREFYNKNFQSVMKKYNINHYSTYTIKKAFMAERVIRTIKEQLYKLFSLNGSYDWLNNLNSVTTEYNGRKHRTTGMRPEEVTDKTPLQKSIYSKIKISQPKKFRIGDVVRISKEKSVFEKGYTPNWSTELFKICSVRSSDPPTYLLSDMKGNPIKGAFYEQEIQKAKYSDVYLVERVLQKRGNKCLVKYLGFPDSENSWVNKKDLGI